MSVYTTSKFEDIVKDIPYNKALAEAFDNVAFPMKNNKFYAYDPSKLAGQEYIRCYNRYVEKTPNGKMSDIMPILAMTMVVEKEGKGNLEKLAQDTIREMYEVPDTVTLSAEIKSPKISDDESGISIDDIKQDRKNELDNEIEKRRILNGLIHGAAVYQWDSAFHMAHEKISGHNENLIQLYNQYSSLINYYNWQHSLALFMNSNIVNNMSGNGGLTQGNVRVDFNTKTVEATALSFPLLIHELCKGVVEYVVGKGLPTKLSTVEMEYVLNIADSYSDEFWYYYMGPTMWKCLLDAADVMPSNLPKILSYLSQMEYEELADFFITICFYPKTGKDKMKIIKRKLNIN